MGQTTLFRYITYIANSQSQRVGFPLICSICVICTPDVYTTVLFDTNRFHETLYSFKVSYLHLIVLKMYLMNEKRRYCIVKFI